MSVKKLKDAEITSIALCKAGKQTDSHIAIKKSDGGSVMKNTMMEIISSLMKAVGLKPEDMEKTVVEIEVEPDEVHLEENEGEEEELEKQLCDKCGLTKGDIENACKCVSKSEEIINESNDIIITADENSEMISPLETEITKSIIVEHVGEVVISGNVNEVAEEITKAIQEADLLRQQVAKMEDENLTREFVNKAATMDAIFQDSEKFGLVLKSISKSNPENYNEIELILKQADNLIKKSKMFDEIGTTNSDVINKSDDAWTQIENMANNIVTKSQDVTKSKAIDMVLQTPKGMELYEQYKNNL